MLLQGSQRAGGKDLAHHLMKDENETVQVFDLRGFVSMTLAGAFQESYALSRATKCKQHLFSLSLNPPQDKTVIDEVFLDAVKQAEERLGLQNQPRAIIFHEKYGTDGKLRKHAHAVWCRIDIANMKAVQLSFTKRKLQDLGRELYIKHGWRMPDGYRDKTMRDPRNFTLAEWQQAKRQGKDPKQLKSMFQERWAVSDSKAGFAHALQEQGLILAKGDRRGFVAVDYRGEVYSIARWCSVKTKQVREKLGDPDDLPSVQQAHARAAKMVTDRLRELRNDQHQKAERFKTVFDHRSKNQEAQHQQERDTLANLQKLRARREDARRDARLRTGIIGLWDRLTGRHRKMETLNKEELAASLKRDVSERQKLATQFKSQLEKTNHQAQTKQADLEAIETELSEDIKWLEVPTDVEQPQLDEEKTQDHQRSRDGPEPEI